MEAKYGHTDSRAAVYLVLLDMKAMASTVTDSIELQLESLNINVIGNVA